MRALIVDGQHSGTAQIPNTTDVVAQISASQKWANAVRPLRAVDDR
jgi:hypothetical protein